ncbi:carbonic anhydrase [Micromonospora sp. WMMD1128]|uniref:carbonic anhydrase n=1 Tax=unclassified Micromonospora TaxID=2617518 RepID=UPI00248BEE59|nr:MULTISPECIES: carbonic anhydrase [unclassified Micromonospora]WBB75114.1 carbonic anhydrase [Micromonospora sp. WMMD1128]WFE31510.1 carbonic anhydrase [Micromonospora sp. WMMD975]
MPSTPAARSPRAALAELLTGNRRFVSGQPLHGHDVSAAAAVASGDQQPYAVVLGCIDSRVPLEAIFDQTFGSICVIRTGAHVLDRAVCGSIEYVVGQLGVRLVMVLGHERCGAVGSAVDAVRTGRRPGGALAYVVDRIAPAVVEVGVDDPAVHPLAIRRHVRRTVAALRADDRLAGPVAAGDVAVVGALYDLATGAVTVLPEEETRDRPPG